MVNVSKNTGRIADKKEKKNNCRESLKLSLEICASSNQKLNVNNPPNQYGGTYSLIVSYKNL